MQHLIKVDQFGARGETMADAIQACVHCGFCLAACPTYQVMGEEMDSPRGRIYLMKNVLEETITSQDAQPYIDRCLGCVACVPACPSGVPYGELLMSYRANTRLNRKRPLLDAAAQRLIVETLPSPQRFRWAVQSGKIGKKLKGSLPAQFRSMVDLLPDTLPPSFPLPEIYPAIGKRRGRVALLAGCVQQVLAPDINWATLHVLAENGIETLIPPQQNCCGSILMHIGEDVRAQRLAANNLRIFPKDVDAILTNAAGCGSGMKEYGLLFKGSEDEELANAFVDKVADIHHYLDSLGFKEPAGFPKQTRVAYQDACHLRHAQGIYAAPRRLLTAVPNLTLLELTDGGLCCGSAGTYNLDEPVIAAELGQRKAAAIRQTGAEVVVSGNIGCLTQIQTHLGEQIPVRHTMELLAAAYGTS